MDSRKKNVKWKISETAKVFDSTYQSWTISKEVSDTLVLGHRAINRVLVLKLVSWNYFRDIRPDLLDQPGRDHSDMVPESSPLHFAIGCVDLRTIYGLCCLCISNSNEFHLLVNIRKWWLHADQVCHKLLSSPCVNILHKQTCAFSILSKAWCILYIQGA